MALVPTVPGLEVHAVTTADEMHTVRRLHADCYVSSGYVPAEQLDSNGYIADPWIPFSDYYAAVDTALDNTVVGTCRIIRPSVRGFPAFQECETSPAALDTFARLDPSRCCEISALATPRMGMQNMAISAALYGVVWQESLRHGRAYMLAVMDNRLLRIMTRWFEFPFETIGDPCDYMGSPSTPVSMYLPRTIEVLSRHNPEALQFFSGNIPFNQLNEIAIDLRDSVPEHRPNVVDLTANRATL